MVVVVDVVEVGVVEGQVRACQQEQPLFMIPRLMLLTLSQSYHYVLS